MKIYDCFIFFNELEILDIRLNTLDKYVDYFVICESKRTFSFNDKPLYYEQNKHLFEKFAHKIIHVVTDFDINSPWGNEEKQRNDILNGLKHLGDNDIIMLSDVDEIPDLSGFDFKGMGDKVYGFEHNYYYYYLNVKMSLAQPMTRIFKFSHIRTNQFQKMRATTPDVMYYDKGWHFSFIGDADRARLKIESFAHQDMNLPEHRDNMEVRIDKLIDPFNRGYSLEIVPIETLPEYIQQNTDKFKHLLR